MTSSVILSSFVPWFSWQMHHCGVKAPLQWWRSETCWMCHPHLLMQMLVWVLLTCCSDLHSDLLQHGMCARSCLVKKWITTYCSIFFTHFGFSPGCWFIQAEQISMVKFKVSKYPPLKTQCVIILAAVVSFFKCFDWKQWWWTKNWWLIFREWGLILILGISRVICKVSLQIFKRA